MRNMNPVLIKGALTSKIAPFYEEYKDFMLFYNLPKFEVKPYNGTEKKSATTSISYSKNKFVLSIEQHQFTLARGTIKSLLFHEFTHIYDYTTILPDLSYSERNELLHAYTEYHATQVEMMCACDFKKVNDIKRIDNEQIIYNGNCPMNIIDYLIFEKQDYLETVKELVTQKCTIHDEIMVIVHSIYYQSKMDFFNKYCSFNISEVTDIYSAQNICGDKFVQLISLITNSEKLNKKEQFVSQYNLFKEVGLYIHTNKNKIMDYLM